MEVLLDPLLTLEAQRSQGLLLLFIKIKLELVISLFCKNYSYSRNFLWTITMIYLQVCLWKQCKN